jgi:DNA-binding XRE family transcriptional regulator
MSAVAKKKEGFVRLPRSEYEALVEKAEDAEDILAVADEIAREAELGKTEARKNYLSAEEVRRMIRGEHPIRIYREHQGLTLAALAKKAAVQSGYLSEIENRKKPGSVETLAKIAGALGLKVDDLI